MPKYQYVQVGFTPDTLDELDSIAETKEISRSELLRRMVSAEIQ